MNAEPWLIRPQKTKEILAAHDIRLRKRFGQNFLVDARVPEQIIAAADVAKTDLVIEIGPGIGTLTQYLCANAGAVRAIEIDRSLLPVLDETLASWDNVKVISGDVMKIDLHEVIEEGRSALQGAGAGARVRVVANLPYYITTPILMKLLEEELPLASITVMVQKEVADRMKAAPGTADYGALSLAVQYYAKPEIAAVVPPHCFIPHPNVESAVVHLTRLDENARVQVKDRAFLFRLIRAAFSKRRKTLVNALRTGEQLDLTREPVEAALDEMGLSRDIRGEALSLSQFAKLADRLSM